MDRTPSEPLSYPFNQSDTLDLDPRYDRLRAECPMARVTLPYGEEAWLATRYEDARLVLGDPRFSRVVPPGHDEPRLGEYQLDAGMMSMDPPEQTRIRRLASKAFAQHGVESLRPKAIEVANELVDTMIELGSPVDLVAHLARPLPAAVIGAMFGVPAEDQAQFGHWMDSFLSATDHTPERLAQYQAELGAYVTKLLAERMTEPRGDLLSALALARDNDDRFTAQEILQLAAGLLAAGHETTASQIPNFVLTLLRNPAELARITEDPGLIPQAVEELTRFVPLGISAGFPRWAKEDVEVGGVLVKAGEPVLAAVASANRDEVAFPNANTLDVTRPAGPHLGFGHGSHYCLGAPLARLELQVTLATLVSRLPKLRLAVPFEELRWKRSIAVRCAVELPISWG